VAVALTPITVGLAAAVPYLLLVSYSAPRFLLPAFALLSVPVGVALHRAVQVSTRNRGLGRTVAAVLILILGVQILSQQSVLAQQTAAADENTRIYPVLATELARAGLRPPCVISGTRSPQIAFYTRCRSRNVDGHDGSITVPALQQLAHHEPVALVLEPGTTPPHYVRTWKRHRLAVPNHRRRWIAYLAPGK
jgi:hypothetical protein